MSIVSAFVVFAVLWFVVLFCLLPIGVRSQEEAGDDIPEGAMAGAPSNPNMRAKAIGATVISAALTVVLWLLVYYRILTLGVINGLFGVE